MSKQVLHIVLNNFTNDSRVLRECKTLTGADFNVHVFALHQDDLDLTEVRETYNLTRFSLQTRSLPKSFFWQSIKYIECLWKMVLKGRRIRPILVHAHDRNALPIGYLISRLTRSKLVYDAHELWGHTSHASQRPGFFKKLAAKMERFIARRSHGVITASEPTARHMEKSFGFEGIILLRNLPYYKEKGLFPRDESPLRKNMNISSDKVVLLYQGVVSKYRGLETLIRAAKHLDNQFVVVILGNGVIVNELKELASHLGIANKVFFHPAVPPSELAPYTAGGDIGMSLIEDICLSYRYCLPNKLFEYMQAGFPVIVSDLPEMRKVVNKHKVGLVLEDWDPESIANSINTFWRQSSYSTYAENAVKAAKQYCWDIEQKKLSDLYASILK